MNSTQLKITFNKPSNFPLHKQPTIFEQLKLQIQKETSKSPFEPLTSLHRPKPLKI